MTIAPKPRSTSSAVVLPLPVPPVMPTTRMPSASASAMVSASSAPARSILYGAALMSMSVDSRPMPHSPPSMTTGIFPAKYSMTFAAVLGLSAPEGLAEGAANGTPARRSASSVSG